MKPESVVSPDETYQDVTWHQQFFDEEGGQLHSFEFKIPPPAISIGENVEFAFSNDKGRVIKVHHYFSDNLRHGEGKPHLRHFIMITLRTNSGEGE